MFNKNCYALKFVNHNFTHRPLGIWILLKWVMPIQDNIALNYNSLFQEKTIWFQLVAIVHKFIYFYIWRDMCFYSFVVANNFYRLPMYPWQGSSQFIVLKFEILNLKSSNMTLSILNDGNLSQILGIHLFICWEFQPMVSVHDNLPLFFFFWLNNSPLH